MILGLTLARGIVLFASPLLLFSEWALAASPIPETAGQSQTACLLETVAGGGTHLAGDGGPAVEAELHSPVDAKLAPDGSLWIADSLHAAIRRVGPDGAMTTVVGTGESGFSGDGGHAASARISGPRSLAFGPDGSAYFVDSGNRRVRQVAPAGTISTVVGDGSYFHFDNVPATQTGLASTVSVAVANDGSLILAEREYRRLRRVGPDGVISTIAGKGVVQTEGGPALDYALSSPDFVVATADGAIYFRDGSSVVRRIGPDGTIATIVRGDFVRSLTASEEGALWYAGNEVRSLQPDGAFETVLGVPEGLAPPDFVLTGSSAAGPIFVNSTEHRVYRFNPEGGAEVLAGVGPDAPRGDGGPAAMARLETIPAFALDGEGNLYIASPKRIRMVGADGVIRTVAGIAEGGTDATVATDARTAGFGRITGLAAGSDGALYVSDQAASRVYRIEAGGALSVYAGNGESWCYQVECGDGGPATESAIGSPAQLMVDGAGAVYVLHRDSLRDFFPDLWVRRIGPDGVISTLPLNTAVFGRRVNSIGLGADGAPVLSFGGSEPLWRLQEDRTYSPLAMPNAWSTAITSFAANPNGDVFFAASANQRIERISPEGVLSVVAGARLGAELPSGDGPAQERALGGVGGLTLHGDDLYFVDSGRVRVVRGVSACSAPVRPQVAPFGFVNGASFRSTAGAPGEIFSLFGVRLGPESGVGAGLAADGGFPLELSGVRVLVDGRPVPLTFASSGQVNAILPFDLDTSEPARDELGRILAVGPSELVVEYEGSASEAKPFTPRPANPGVFVLNAEGQAAALNEDSSVNGPLAPAQPGSVIVVFATGGGQTDPEGEDGKIAGVSPLKRTVLPVTATIGRLDAEVLYAGVAPGLVEGVLQVNLRIPEALQQRGAVDLLLEIGETGGRFGPPSSQFGVTVVVE